jgi:hypothetical protein
MASGFILRNPNVCSCAAARHSWCEDGDGSRDGRGHWQGPCWRWARDTRRARAGCQAVQPVPADPTTRALGLPRLASTRRPRAPLPDASRALHPTAFRRPPRASGASLAASAVNRARRTLRSPVTRGRYWLELTLIARDDRTRAARHRRRGVRDAGEARGAARGGRAARRPRRSAARRALHDELAARLRALTDAPTHDTRLNGGGDLGEPKRRLSEIAYPTTRWATSRSRSGRGEPWHGSSALISARPTASSPS